METTNKVSDKRTHPHHPIEVGDCYVREYLGKIRKILDAPSYPFQDCVYEEYKLETGELTRDSHYHLHACSVSALLEWADRKVTAEEENRMRGLPSHQERLLDRSRCDKWDALHNLSDDDLLNEVKRRGLTLGKERSNGKR